MEDTPRNIIFLDVDGVLNTGSTRVLAPSGYMGVDPWHIRVLASIVREHEALIVLSSTWKDGWNPDKALQTDPDLDYLEDMLSLCGLTIADKTPGSSYYRGTGIRDWLRSHPHRGWLVLDDEIFPDFERQGILPHLIRTSRKKRGGLLPLHRDLAAEIFALGDGPEGTDEGGGEAAGGFIHHGKPGSGAAGD